ncbi:Protein mlp1 [Elasticomyces elasticus]|uniref:Protein mlp1 n=1 Tax=Elasticomyces elasticus TaxID=574655 RepID=A0AAN8A507_9PEZI|nr:Protein mlp1 [Elasticomyces elasticus]
MAADPSVVDLPYLHSTYDIPELDIQNLLDAPTTELVKEFLASLTNKGQDFETLKADKLKVEVELENTVRTSETKARAQKGQITKHVKEVEELRTKLSTAEAARESLASELNQLQSSTSGSTAETSALRQRIETLEASNRDALALVESKSTEKDRVATELSEQHGKLLGLRKEINTLEEKNQSLQNAASSQKFKEQSLQQEIDLLKRNNDWHTNELQTRNQEHAKFRKERNARISSLQRELEDSNAQVETLKRTETTLRQRLDEVQSKLDEGLARVASLQEEQVRKEQDFRTELDSTKRLAELQAQNAATHKARLQDLQGQIEGIREDAAEEIGRLQAEIETERSDKEQAERRVAELELAVERLEQAGVRPSTPSRNGGPATPYRGGSPAMSGSLRKTVNGLSFTELYSQFTDAQQALESEKRRTKKLGDAMDELVSEMESRAPQMQELQAENERLEMEVLGMSAMLDEANGVREEGSKAVQHWQSEAKAVEHEAEVLRQQLRDLGAQMKILLVDLQSRDQGLEDMSVSERLELERAARGEIDEEALQSMTDTGRFIAERLVIFRDVSELQEKNQQMLRLTRTLGEQLEGEEAMEQKRQSAEYKEENEGLKSQVGILKDELQATVQQIDSYMKERDMFRRMLQHRGTIPAGEGDLHAMFGQSQGPPATPSRNGPPPTPRSQDVQDLNKLLKEQQAFFDQYRDESATDRRTLKEQVDALAKEKSGLQAVVSRLQSQLELANGRYEMLQGNLTATRNENAELQKRSAGLAEQAARQDLRVQQVAEELVEARGVVEGMRNEVAHGKAERELWKRIEGRLGEDNKALVEERQRLNKLVGDLQNLQNERELAEGEARRRIQGRVEGLEGELAETKRKLEYEVEEGRKGGLRREYEEGQARTRIDDLVKSLGNVREELVAAKTTRDSLQARVEEMKIDLRAAEEKAAALQPRPTPRAEQTNGVNGGDELSAEQRLGVEVSDLKRDLELARNELEGARQQVEQYRSIAQSTEEELERFTETNEQYKEETDRVISEKDARVKELEQKVEDLTTELATTSTGMSELRSQADEATRALEEQKGGYESELARLKDDAERYAEEKVMLQGDIKAQAEIAQQAQQAYEEELVKHAGAAQGLLAVRREYNELRTEVAGVRVEAEAAKASLERGEESWGEMRGRLEREVEELGRRREDVERQNGVLHRQMEGFSGELKALREGRKSVVGGGGEGGEAGSSGRDENLQEVIRFLRREKEIVDVQYELSMQEAKRLQQQLDYANSTLETVRQTLADERRQAAEKTREEGSVTSLQQTINELNLHRESATTLRNEARVARERLEEKVQEIERLAGEIEPLQGRIGELEGEVEAKDGELQLLQRDRDHWRERTQNIISKYDRVDPAELESMKGQLEELRAEKERLEGEQAPLREQIAGHEAKLEEQKAVWVDKLEKFRDQAKERNRKQNQEKTDLGAERDRIKAELESVKTELEGSKSRLAEVEKKLAAAEKAKENGEEEGEVNENGDEHAALHARISEAEARAGEHAGRAEELSGQVTALQARVGELEGQVTDLQGQLEAAKTNSGRDDPPPSQGGDNEALEKLRQDLANAQQDLESLRAVNSVQTGGAGADKPTAGLDVQAAVDQLRAEMESQHQLALAQKDEECNRKMEGLKQNLKRQLSEGRDRQRSEATEELITQHAAEVQKLKEENETAVRQMREAHAAELERLSKDGSAAVQRAGSEAVESIKPEETIEVAGVQVSDAQMLELLKTNERAKTILRNNITKGVEKGTEQLKQSIKEKEEEIEKLKEDQTQAQSSTASSGGEEKIAELQTQLDEAVKARDELQVKLDAAQKDKEAAVARATDTAEKKTKVQLSMRDRYMAQINAVKKAVADTPEKAVKEVWEVAQEAKPPPPKVAPPVIATGSASSPAQQKPAGGVPPSPSVTQAPTAPATQRQQSPVRTEADKMKARQERFSGIPSGPASTTPAAPAFGQSTGTFGKPSTFGQPSGTFGQPSQSGPVAQPDRRPNSQQGPSSPNPQAPAFTPAAPRSNIGTGPAALRGLSSGLPRLGGSGAPRGGRGGSNGISIQGAAAAAQQHNDQGVNQRGGMQSGLPRGPGNFGRGGGRGRGGLGNAGQKRPYDGDGGAGDGKRTRGGGPGGAEG